MAHDSVETRNLPFRTLDAFPRPMFLAAVGLVAIGALALVTAVITDADRAWQAYLFNWLHFAGIAQGAVILAAAVTITKAIWARPVRRIALSFVAFLPIAFVLYLPLAFAGKHIFPWSHVMYFDGLEVWLNEPFVAIRNIVALGALFGLSLLFAAWALRPDAGAFREQAPTRYRGLYARLSRDWRDTETEEIRAWHRLNRLAPVLCLVYAVAMSVVAWDYVMSLEAGWFSTLIGPYFFMAAFLGGVAATAIAAVAYRSALGLAGIIEGPHFHDLGKLTFAFCVFWAYLLWSQYIVIWYGMLPWEQTFLVHRLSGAFAPLAVVVFFCLFVIPFFTLLGVRPKKNPAFLAAVAGLVLLGIWLERYLLVYPSLHPNADAILFGWQEIGIGLFFAGLLLGSVVWFATAFPILQVWQPAIRPDLLEDVRLGKDHLAAHGAPETRGLAEPERPERRDGPEGPEPRR